MSPDFVKFLNFTSVALPFSSYYHPPITTVSASPWRGLLRSLSVETLSSPGSRRGPSTSQHKNPAGIHIEGMLHVICNTPVHGRYLCAVYEGSPRPVLPTRRSRPRPSIGYPTPGLLNLELLPGVNGLIVGTSCICWGLRVCRLVQNHWLTGLLVTYTLSK